MQMVLPVSRPIATEAHTGYSAFLNGPLIARSFVAKIQPFAELAAPDMEGAILTPTGGYRHSRTLSKEIEV